MDGSSSKRRRREAAEKEESLSLLQRTDAANQISSVKMNRKIIFIPSSCTSNLNNDQKVISSLNDTISDQNVTVEMKTTDEISELEFGDIVCIVSVDEDISVICKFSIYLLMLFFL